MIGTSWQEYVLIRLSILALRAITPLSVAYTLTYPLHRRYTDSKPLLAWIKYWSLSETLFYSLVFLPLKHSLLREKDVVSTLPGTERRALFAKCVSTVNDQEIYLQKWFLNASIEDIRKDNVKEFLAWSLLNKRLEDVSDDENDELGSYVDLMNKNLKVKLRDGIGSAKPLRLAFDDIPIWHRPLLWYSIVGLVELNTSARLLYNGWTFYRTPLSRCLSTFPPRIWAFSSNSVSPGKSLTYWHCKPQRPSSTPILFIHGIGIGLHPYVTFLNNLSRGFTGDAANEPQSEVIGVEILPISGRMCSSIVSTETIRNELQAILERHGWTEFVLVAHSYGTAVAANLYKDPYFKPRIKQLVLLDPICFMLHLPDVAYNFTRRPPRRANEYLLHYFSSTDMMVSHTLARRFFWTEYVLWLEDISEVPTFITLAEKDLVINSAAVWNYLQQSTIEETDVDVVTTHSRNDRLEARVDGREVWKFDRLDHAQIFDYAASANAIARRIRQRILEHS